MNEFDEILCDIFSLQGECVLATVFRTEGTTFRKRGARALFTSAGLIRGAVSGGCVESELADIVWPATQNGPVSRSFDSRSPDDLLFGYGTGCPGLVEVVLERVSAETPWVKECWRCRNGRQECSLVVTGSGTCIGSGDPVFGYRPPWRLALFGANSNAIPLCSAACSLGWRVSVFDHRPGMLGRRSFGEAEEVLLEGQELGTLVDERTAVLVTNHHFMRDLEHLRVLLPSSAPYVGVVSSPGRAALLRERLAGTPGLDRLVSPVGILNATHDPSSMAVSILAQLHSCLSH